MRPLIFVILNEDPTNQERDYYSIVQIISNYMDRILGLLEEEKPANPPQSDNMFSIFTKKAPPKKAEPVPQPKVEQKPGGHLSEHKSRIEKSQSQKDEDQRRYKMNLEKVKQQYANEKIKKHSNPKSGGGPTIIDTTEYFNRGKVQEKKDPGLQRILKEVRKRSPSSDSDDKPRNKKGDPVKKGREKEQKANKEKERERQRQQQRRERERQQAQRKIEAQHRERQRIKERERQKERQRQEREKQRLRRQKQRQDAAKQEERERLRRIHDKIKERQGRSGVERSREKKVEKRRRSSSPSGSSSDDEEKRAFKALRKLTGYNPKDKKYKMLDKEIIIESGARDLFKEERYSERVGRMEDEHQLRLLMKEKSRKKHHDERR